MKSAILRTGSIPIQNLNRTPAHSGSIPSSPRVSFRSENIKYGNLKRSSSDTDLIRPELVCSRVGSVSIPDLGVIVEEESSGGIGIGIGNGKGKGNDYGRKRKVGDDESNDKCKIEEYYEEMLNSNPGNSLLLRNYGKYLHQVKKNAEKAEEYYGRAILANPGDGELLSLYGDLIWETSKDEHRAQLYFDQAVTASPNDCMVLGSYAHFLWEVEDDDDQSTCINHENVGVPGMVGVH